MMIVRSIKVFVKPECVEEFKKATVKNRNNSIKEPGVLRFDLLSNREKPYEFLLFEVYHSEKATEDHKKTAHYLEWKAAVEDMMASPRQSDGYDVVAPDDPNDW